MRPGYTKLLIQDFLVPPTHATPIVTAHDIAMMFALGARERREGDWRRLLQSVGLELVQFWIADGMVTGIMEAQVSD